MERKRMSVFVVVCFFICIGVMDYPFISQLYNEQVQGNVASEYEDASALLNEDVRELEYQKAVEYNKWLSSGAVSFEDTFEKSIKEADGYEQLLSIENHDEIAVIEIPKIHVRLPVYHGTSEEVLQKGAGHLQGSSLPVGGENTHTCILAHRGLPRKEMFTNLDKLQEGDLFYLHVLGKTLTYEVYDTETVPPEQTENLEIQKGEDIATLITCTPYGINTHRLYIHGKRIPYQKEKEKLNFADIDEILEKCGWMLLTAGFLGWMLLLLYWLNRKPGNNRRKDMKKRKKKWKKPVCMVLMCAGCMGIPQMNVDAATGTILISFEKLENEQSKREDLQVCLYRVGKIDENSNPVFDSEYEINEFPKDGESVKELSQEIAEKQKENIESVAKTDASGTVRFEGLEEGIYLVMVPEDNGYGEVSPFLVTIPYYEEEGKPMYEVLAIPKASPYQEEDLSDENTVKTGDMKNMGPYLILGTGAILTVAAIKVKRKNDADKREEHDGIS